MNSSKSNPNQIMIGVHGAIGHGKTTFAEQLHKIEPSSLYFESSTLIAEVLDELYGKLPRPFETSPIEFVNDWFSVLPPIISGCLNIKATESQLSFTKEMTERQPMRYQKLLEHAEHLIKNPSLAEQTINPQNKANYRAGLQGLGGYLVSAVSETIWYDELVRRAKQESGEDTNLIVIGGLRYPADAETVRKAGGFIIEIIRPGYPEADIQDPTEAYRKQIVSDAHVINDGTVDELQQLAEACLTDIKSHHLQEEYSTLGSSKA